MYRVWKLDSRGTCSRYDHYLRFYSDLIDSNSERRARKCENCPEINKKNNVIFVNGDCKFHLIRHLSNTISYSSVLIVPNLNLMKYSKFDIIEQGMDLVDEYKPSMKEGDFLSIHVFKRSREKDWTIELPL